MKKNTHVGIGFFAAVVISLMALGLTGCDTTQTAAPAAKPAMDAKQDAAQPAQPAAAKPKDHPAH